jgi:carbonic anhydrase
VNYAEVEAIITTTSKGSANVTTANAQTDGFVVDGTFVPLNQFHFHTPSEHTINGVHYPLEMHMVHKLFQASAADTTIVAASATGAVLAKAAVIGIMFAFECVP